MMNFKTEEGKIPQLKSLSEFNIQRKGTWEIENNRQPKPNGIACPKCNKELFDSCPDVLLTSLLPQKNVHCPSCGYVGYRIA